MSAPAAAPLSTCRVCSAPINLSEDHVTLAVQVERWEGRKLVVIETTAVGHLCLGCVKRGPDGVLQEPEASDG